MTLGLIHGSQPDALVLCHQPGRDTMRGIRGRPLPEPAVCLRACLEAARLTNPDPRAVGVAVNTSMLTEEQGRLYCEELGAELELPCVDPLRQGVQAIVDELERRFHAS